MQRLRTLLPFLLLPALAGAAEPILPQLSLGATVRLSVTAEDGSCPTTGVTVKILGFLEQRPEAPVPPEVLVHVLGQRDDTTVVLDAICAVRKFVATPPESPPPAPTP